MFMAVIRPYASDIWYEFSKLGKIKCQISVEIDSGLEQKRGCFAIIVSLSLK
jgi:hypothetical protein